MTNLLSAKEHFPEQQHQTRQRKHETNYWIFHMPVRAMNDMLRSFLDKEVNLMNCRPTRCCNTANEVKRHIIRTILCTLNKLLK